MASPRSRVLGIDVGARRIGVAIADLETTVAVPLEVIDTRSTDAVARLSELIEDNNVSTLVVGRPTMLSGDDGSAVAAARSFADAVAESSGVKVCEYDERMTTVLAERRLRDANVAPAKRKQMRDALAAQVILQSYLDDGRWR
ncbi:MAG: Holliday junction resolvase RuvX [Actinomycetota bacterium]|nr:Holliday junction resolvase RuvX [Actinomycetota bacterium]